MMQPVWSLSEVYLKSVWIANGHAFCISLCVYIYISLSLSPSLSISFYIILWKPHLNGFRIVLSAVFAVIHLLIFGLVVDDVWVTCFSDSKSQPWIPCKSMILWLFASQSWALCTSLPWYTKNPECFQIWHDLTLTDPLPCPNELHLIWFHKVIPRRFCESRAAILFWHNSTCPMKDTSVATVRALWITILQCNRPPAFFIILRDWHLPPSEPILILQ